MSDTFKKEKYSQWVSEGYGYALSLSKLALCKQTQRSIIFKIQIHYRGRQGLHDNPIEAASAVHAALELETLSPPTSGGSCSSSTQPPPRPGPWPCTWRGP